MTNDFTQSFFSWIDSGGATFSQVAEEFGNSAGTVANWRSEGIPKGKRFACEAFMKARQEQEIADPVYAVIPIELSPVKFREWNEKSKAADLLIDEWIIQMVDQAANEEPSVANITSMPDAPLWELPFLGAVAAGEPVCAPLDELCPVPREFGPGHYVVEINGQSAEPEFLDGDKWVIRAVETGTPKQGVPCVVSDGSGSYLKKWNRKKKTFESINSAFNDVIPGEEAKLQGYPVEKLS